MRAIRTASPIAAVAVATAIAAADPALAADPKDCTMLPDDDVRLACYDAAVGRVPPADSQDGTATPRLGQDHATTLMRHLKPCLGFILSRDPAVDIEVVIERTGMVESATIVHPERYRDRPDRQAYADRAVKAALDPTCQPWPITTPVPMPIVIRFDPKYLDPRNDAPKPTETQ